MEKKVICIICPLGCRMTVEGQGDMISSITGNKCKRGEVYGRDEFINPTRILTTTVRIDKARIPVISVRSKEPIPKNKMFECMDILKHIAVKSDVKCGDVAVKNIFNTGVDIIVTGTNSKAL